MKNEELIVLLDEQGKPIGTAPKLASHHANTPLHAAFSCYVFNDKDEFLVTQRALSKKVWPGVWTNSVCGHPGPDETHQAAIERRAHDELGATLTDIQVILPDYRYKTPAFNGIVENEICPVFTARLKGGLAPNPEEVEDYSWLTWADYKADLQSHGEKYSYWAKDQLKQLAEKQLPPRRFS
ncbi:MAG TPA: isopentenyl-diphosphate Delta-isomerase [Verrucomicrobiae bacterium]|nr:isopentenyl-diphosphate Delta-isomerase [Verrucomicrobiae bacterium]